MEAAYFGGELALLLVSCLLALSGLGRFGGLRRNRVALLALGLNLLVCGIGVTLVPQRLWPVAREDNAFLGTLLFTLLLVPVGLVLLIACGISVARHAGAGTRAARAVLLAAAGSAISLALLIGWGPEPWQTRPTATWGSGTFGFAYILASMAIGLAIVLIGRWLERTERRD